jgi:hypothetical protein
MPWIRAGLKRLALCVLSAAAATAQHSPMPVGEIGAQWIYNNIELSQNGGWSNQNGGSIFGQYFVEGTGRGMLGVVGQFAGSASQSGSLYTLMAGPRVSINWRRARLVFHADYRIGVDHARVNAISQSGAPASITSNGFAWGSGGFGVDAPVTRRYIVNLFQMDILSLAVPQFRGGSSSEGDLRVSAGITLRLGQR